MLKTTTYTLRVTPRLRTDMPEPTDGPMSVLAVKNRYLPPLSKATWRASLMPSVTWCDRPAATECRKTAYR